VGLPGTLSGRLYSAYTVRLAQKMIQRQTAGARLKLAES